MRNPNEASLRGVSAAPDANERRRRRRQSTVKRNLCAWSLSCKLRVSSLVVPPGRTQRFPAAAGSLSVRPLSI